MRVSSHVIRRFAPFKVPMSMRVLGIVLLMLVVVVGCANAVPPAEDATKPADRLTEGWWKERHEQKKLLRDYRVAFLGDSITQGWEGTGQAAWNQHFAQFKPANFGYSGDRTSHVLWRLEQGELLAAKPELVVLMIGTNNVGHGVNTPAETVAGIRAILAKIRKESPKTKILLIGVLPRGVAVDDPMRKAASEINADLVKLKEPNVTYRDYGAPFVKEDGKINLDLMPDALHLSEAGYQLWSDLILPDLLRLLPRR